MRPKMRLILGWAGCVLVAGATCVAAPDYPEAHPPVGQQPKRPSGYVHYVYPKTPEQLLREQTPQLLERAHAAYNQLEDVVRQGPYHGDHDSIATHPCPEWFEDAKFGMFIDWGPWSVAGWAPQAVKATYPDWYEQRLYKEYHDYHARTWGDDIQSDDLIQLLRGDDFKPADLVALARDSGMRYVVPFLKHHGGYCLWDSSFTHRNSMEWGLHRDIAREMAQACQSAGLKFGAYVSLGEWNYPIIRDGKLFSVSLDVWTKHLADQQPKPLTDHTPFVSGKVPVNDYTKDYLLPSLKELIDHTNPDMLWFDGEWLAPPETWQSADLVAYYYDRAAARGQQVCVNDRMGQNTRGKPGWGDFYTSEFHVIKSLQTHPWEENRSLSHSYGYNWEESFDDRYVLSENDALDLLLHTVANGGNLLLMVSPDGSGRVPPNQEKRLRFIGQWLARNGEAIYATRAVGLSKQPDWGYVTRSKSGDHLYLIVRHWPANGTLRVPVRATASGASVLGGTGKPTVQSDENGLSVNLSGIDASDPAASVIRVDVQGSIIPSPEDQP